MDSIKRREALKRTAWIMGGALSAPTIAGILNGCAPKPELNWKPSFFSEDQASVITEMAETILPETDTPGAKSLGVPSFIEEMVGTVYDDEDRKEFMEGLELLRKECVQKLGGEFHTLSSDVKTGFIQSKNEDIAGVKYPRQIKERPFFWKFKSLTLAGYFTTEYGATQALQYVQIPVEYRGCIPLNEAGNGKTWAT